MAYLCDMTKCVTFCHIALLAWPAANIKLLGGVMTERMQDYRKRMEEKGLVQVRMWVEKQDAEFVKYIAKFCREVREKKERKRYGRRASKQQIDFAKALAKLKNVPEPDHLYNHHISLAGWTWSCKGK
jgi:hypothetical protein